MRAQQSFYYAQGAGFAGPVGTQQPEYFTAFYIEGNIAHGLERAVLHVERFYLENGTIGLHIHRSWFVVAKILAFGLIMQSNNGRRRRVAGEPPVWRGEPA